MAYQRCRKSIREEYEEQFPALDGREVTVHRVVNIVEKKNPMPRPGIEFDRGFNDDQWYGGPRNYQDARECHGEGSYPSNERRYFDDNPNFRRNSSQPRNEGPYSQQCYSRDDLRHQLGSRNSRRTRPYFRNRGRGSGPPQREDHSDYRISAPVAAKRERSPGSREAQPPVRSGSNTSNRSFSPDRDKGYTHQQAQKKHKPNVLTSHAPSSSVEGSPHSSGSSKEKTPASAAETEEAVAASMEPKLTPEDGFKARRLEAIKAKALEIEKHYRQDCETFCTVVKMLVAKEPSLGNLLQAPLDENLLEIKQRCLESLRHFVKELDETIGRGGDRPDLGSPHTSSTTHMQTEEDFSHQCCTNTTCTDEKQEGSRQPANRGDSAPVPAGNQGEGRGKHTGDTEDSTSVPETCRPGRPENLATPGSEDSHSEPMELLSVSPLPPAQQGLQKRLQLYNSKGEKFSCTHLSNPQAWQDITYARPGWIPDHLPYLTPGKRYWELRANSTVVFRGTPPYGEGQKKEKVACGVTCYIHVEGPWCEVQSHNGTRICALAAPPTTAWISPVIMQGPPELNAREGLRRRPRVHSASVPYLSKQKGSQA
ncbi:uncharacterized protein LOC121608445 isoform X3 [Chelmon rostratus]|nr:uncharacterized protein LOC121608445 isoform X2 [Chelmon rostratus]XP_041795656.1 uncharacterized protein LOC121608445 isoform X2 [Chelmon rostratus]XP_041795658.1 uncharacterized protein LOC121608445 isoform X2 [Chelmon rostratus]XP_041795659.1 uncharacterized protein LOC121608445 isoform X3 [Chelmon rostratus]XP_041795660.1 uncharacterized protein LOC121608445 isoform X3 [Chelmon rostratus]